MAQINLDLKLLPIIRIIYNCKEQKNGLSEARALLTGLGSFTQQFTQNFLKNCKLHYLFDLNTFFFCLSYTSLVLCKYLFMKKASVISVTKTGNTMLHAAVFGGCQEAVKLCLESGKYTSKTRASKQFISYHSLPISKYFFAQVKHFYCNYLLSFFHHKLSHKKSEI